MTREQKLSNEYLAECLEFIPTRYDLPDGARKICEECVRRLENLSADALALEILKQIAGGPGNNLNRRLARSALTFIECLIEERERK